MDYIIIFIRAKLAYYAYINKHDIIWRYFTSVVYNRGGKC